MNQRVYMMFHFSRYCKIIFQSGCNNLHPIQIQDYRIFTYFLLLYLYYITSNPYYIYIHLYHIFFFFLFSPISHIFKEFILILQIQDYSIFFFFN